MSDFSTPRNVSLPRALTGKGVATAGAGVQMVSVSFGEPQFARCRVCGCCIARLGDRERWHHVDRTIGHLAERSESLS